MAADVVLVGRGTQIDAIPASAWWSALVEHLPRSRARFEQLPALHRAVRRAAVLALVRTGRPVPPQNLADEVGAPLPGVRAALDDLERWLFFLVRDAAGDVAWAFPFPAEATPHRVSFSSGERLYGAWAEDAFATPLVQGRLQGRPARARIDSRCGLCAEPIRIDVDEELRWRTSGTRPPPLIFEPSVDWSRFRAAHILDDY